MAGLIKLHSLSLFYAIVSLALCYVAIVSFDQFLFRNISFKHELKRGNVAVGIVVASIIIGVFCLFSGAIK